MITSRHSSLIAAATLCLALTACGGQNSSAPTSGATATTASSSKAASGQAASSQAATQTIQGPGFTVTADRSWHESASASASPSESADQGFTYTQAPVGGVAPELRGMVMTSDDGSAPTNTEELSASIDKMVSGSQGTDDAVSRLGTITLGGDRAFEIGGGDKENNSYHVGAFVLHGGKVYALSLTEPNSVSKDECKQRFEAIAQTWAWTK